MTLANALIRPSLSWRGSGAVYLMLRSQIRGYSTPSAKRESQESSLAAARQQHEVSADVKPLGERIKENTKTASYTGVILLGIGVTGALFYTIFRELFSSSSPNSVYSAALEKCINDPRVQDALGAPIKGYGEESSRRRRRHVAHSVYQRDGVNHMRMQFYVQGIRNKATVHLEVKENSAGSYDYRYIFAQLDHYPRTTIILEDNRVQDGQKNAPLPSLY
ncbi:mitochondrial import inner membrane translocase subunit Tim21 [Phlebotomus argentipes]|uniref:mitochondrial import inner membrane translocase subunit Tim21 n=1 Tax=Phlebotomus argentipes TaxID=94469 RepID=UPI002892AD40|nr:mitochondrial import inner membrane translocase subunit Tim21 [Phlebotomus argentipes]